MSMKGVTMWTDCRLPRVVLLFFLVIAGCVPQEDERDDLADPASITKSEDQTATEAQDTNRERRSQGRRRGYGKTNGGRGRGRLRSIIMSDGEQEAVQIQTVKATYRTLKSFHTAMGRVLAPQPRMAIVTYAFPARVAEIHVGIGDWVERNQKLLTLQSEEVGVAKSEFFKAEADLELARTNYEREKRLFDRGVGAQKNLLMAEATMKVAGANLEAIEKKLHVLGFTEQEVRSLSETHQINPVVSLYAPIEGKIIEHRAVLGAMIDQSTELLTIIDPRLLWIDAEIFERDISKIRAGQTVRISVPAFPSQTFTGKISYIGDVLNEKTRTVTVRTEVGNRDLRLKPGMFADIEILLNHKSRMLVLPSEAILDDGEDSLVFLKIGSEYVPRIVVVGVRDDGLQEIVDGVEEGDEVVTVGNYQLKSKLDEERLGSRTH